MLDKSISLKFSRGTKGGQYSILHEINQLVLQLFCPVNCIYNFYLYSSLSSFIMRHLLILLSIAFFWSCAQKNQIQEGESEQEEEVGTAEGAAVVKVEAQGNAQTYTFLVTVQSPDTGCDQYADWWEVVSLDGDLIYRRVLLHSHVSEQPFTRSGGAVAIEAEQEVYVRAHMNNKGYGTKVMKGSPEAGFETAELAADFAKDLDKQEPLPKDCDF